jgi:hypothetical protein
LQISGQILDFKYPFGFSGELTKTTIPLPAPPCRGGNGADEYDESWQTENRARTLWTLNGQFLGWGHLKKDSFLTMENYT